MRQAHTFLVRLLLPALLVVFAAMLISLAALYYLKEQYSERLLVQKRDIAALHLAVGISEDMADIQRQVTNLLARAAAGQMNEAEVYRVHAALVDRFSLMAHRVQNLSTSPSIQELTPEESEALRNEFASYRNYVVMATDIAAIEPATAGRHIANARDHFVAFYHRANVVVRKVSEHVETMGNHAIAQSVTVMQQLAAVIVIGFLLTFALSFIAARSMARRVESVASGLAALAQADGLPLELPAIERMHAREHNEFGRLAGSVLRFRHALIERHHASVKLSEYQHVLERTIDELQESKRHESELRDLAFYDALTGLPNRRLMLDRLQHALKIGKRHGRCLAVLFLDLNRFKELNDTHGHQAGDLMLKEVARRLLAEVRTCDTVARLGGDEFLVLLEELPADPQQAADSAECVAAKIRAALACEYVLGNIRHPGSASVGISINIEGDPETIIQAADEAMYAMKNKNIVR